MARPSRAEKWQDERIKKEVGETLQLSAKSMQVGTNLLSFALTRLSYAISDLHERKGLSEEDTNPLFEALSLARLGSNLIDTANELSNS